MWAIAMNSQDMFSEAQALGFVLRLFNTHYSSEQCGFKERDIRDVTIKSRE